MTPSHRVWSIYRKELLEIIRDRRTLTAMVVIPVVLYPLLMLGFLRAAESEEARLRSQEFVVQAADEQTAAQLRAIIEAVRRHQEKAGSSESQGQSPVENGMAAPPEPSVRATFDVRVGHLPPGELGDDVQLQVRLESHVPAGQATGLSQSLVRITYNEVNIKSRTAMDELTDVIGVFRELEVRERVETLLGSRPGRSPTKEMNVDAILEPLRVETVSVATERQRGGWALGQIIPIILVLMTITGSVYPAIDLTAGERERGTLETLMATPVPPLQLILGKFLVVATLGMLTAFLNVASVGATMHFSGLTRSITQQMPVEIPVEVLPIVLLCMVPFSLLFAAILVAVCSFARTFKEAQSYVMPVILGALIPAVAVTLPTARLGGILLVLPVGNMVLLARELFEGSYLWSQVAIVLVSTSLYAVAALAMAVRLFGQEAVVFADSGSYRTLLLRRYYRPSSRPTLSQALLLAALMFPASFYAQSVLSGQTAGDFLETLGLLAIVQFGLLFVLLPLGITLYYRINAVETFRLRLPPGRAWIAAVLLGLSSWAVAQQLVALQTRLMAPSDALQKAFELIETQLAAAPLWQVLLLLALVPAVAEEFFFRGFLLSGLSGPRDGVSPENGGRAAAGSASGVEVQGPAPTGLGKWAAIVVAGFIFGIFHFVIDRVPVTALLGICLAWLCWQTRSIWPGMLFHFMHNGLLITLNSVSPEAVKKLGVPDKVTGLLPARIIIPALVLFAAGLVIAASSSSSRPPRRKATADTVITER